MKRKWLSVLFSLFLVACGEQTINGPINVKVIRPVAGRRCEYVIAPATLTTVTSLRRMSGAVGSVVYTRENLGKRPEILDTGDGLDPVDVEFSRSGNEYSPLDLNSLYAASLYYAVETAHLTFSRLDASADMTRVVSDFGSTTRIVHEARRTFGEVGIDPEVTDNAEYLSHRVKQGGQEKVFNYLISYPTVDVEDIPLGLNLGIMAHEYSHLVMHHLFYEPGFARNVGVSSGKPTTNTLAALDEGMADYFGFLASGDPSFFQCSFPNEDRDLLVTKSFTDQMIAAISGGSGFSQHRAGAVWAAINYEIGNAIGHDVNGRLLVRLMGYLLDCPDTQGGTNSVSIDFKAVASCHVRLAGAQAAQLRQIYNSRLGSYGGI